MNFSRFFSVFFHPVFMPLLIVCLYINLTGLDCWGITRKDTLVLYFILFFFSVLIPVISLFYLIKQKSVSSIEMENKKERPKPLFITCVSMFLGGVFIIFLANNTWVAIRSVYLSFCFIILVSAIISKYWKISLHMLGCGGVCGALLILYLQNITNIYVLLLFLILSFIVAIARIKENAHNKLQVYIGFLVGIIFEASFIVLL